MKRSIIFTRTLSVVILFLACSAGTAFAADGRWTLDGTGLWGNLANWNGGAGPIADGSGFTADFSTINITGDRTVHLDSARTIGNLVFGDLTTSSAGSWILDNDANAANILTLAGTTPTITVNALGSGKVASISAKLAGISGLAKAGVGTLTLNGAGANTYTGSTTVNRGTMIVDFANLAAATDLINSASTLVMGGGTLQVKQKSATVTSQTFAGTTINAGASAITATNVSGSDANTLTVALGGITRNVGGVVNFTLPASTGSYITTTTANDVSGILGRWATTGLTTSLRYGANDGGGNIVAYTGASVTDPNLSTVTSATTNYELSVPGTVTGIATALTGNTLRYTGGTATLNIGADANTTNTLKLNGLMNAGSGALTIARTGLNATGGIVVGDSNEMVIVTNNQGMTISAPIKDNSNGPGAVTFASYGGGSLTLTGASSYSGGTVVNAGSVTLGNKADSALGTGPLTLNPGTTLNIDNNTLSIGMTLNDATITGGNSFGTVISGPITVTGVATLLTATGTGNIDYMGDISGPGSVRSLGSREDSQLAVDLFGTNTFAGPAIVAPNANIRFNKRVSLPNTGSWTADKLVVEAGGAAYFKVGGTDEFTAADIAMLAALGTDTGGFKNGSYLGLENGGNFTYTNAIADTNGGANKLGLKKFGNGKLTLGDNNTYTGPTYLHAGTLEVSSLNSVVGGKAGSSLGAPKTIADGTIVLNPYTPTPTLRYIGGGETTDRMINAKGSNLKIDQSGTGLLKFTGNIAGTSDTPTFTLLGSSTGEGEFAGTIGSNKAANVVKDGSGTWTLSGMNLYTGKTTLTAGVLSVASISDGGFTPTLTTTAGSAIVTASSTAGLIVGQSVNSPKIPAGATIASIGDATHFTLTSGTGVTAGANQVSTIGTPSNLGFATSAAGNLVFNGGTLRYTGADAGTNRNFTINAGKTATIDVTTSNLTLSGASTATTGILKKTGAATLTLSGANAHTGGTTVSEGRLVVDNAAGTGTGAVTVAADATLALSGPVNQIATGALTLQAGAIYEWALGGSSADVVDVTGNLTLDDGWKLSLVDAGGGAPQAGTHYTLLTYSGNYLSSTWIFDSSNIDAGGTDWTVSGASIVVDAGEVYITGLSSVLPGDTNGDGVVDTADYIAVKRNLGLTTGASLGQGNVDGDGDVDWDDLQMVMTNFGNGASTAPATTPEPCSAMLLVLGAMAVVRRRARIGRISR